MAQGWPQQQIDKGLELVQPVLIQSRTFFRQGNLLVEPHIHIKIAAGTSHWHNGFELGPAWQLAGLPFQG